jgi:hypothetical protein
MLRNELRATGPARRRSAAPAPMEANSVTPYASLEECDHGGDTALRLRADRKPALEASGGGIIRRQADTVKGTAATEYPGALVARRRRFSAGNRH